MLSVFTAPARYTQGKNATAMLGREMVTLGLVGPALVVAGTSASKLLAETWHTSLGAAGIGYAVHHFGGESSQAEVDRVVAAARKVGAQVVIGAGGGKVLDTARAAADALNLPVVNCPTVVSTDAPTSALSVLYTPEGVFQEYRFYRRNPDLVLVDTQVIARSPPRLFVAGMGDALSTYFEARTCAEGRRTDMPRRDLDPGCPGAGRAVLPDGRRRWPRGPECNRDASGDPGPGAGGGGQHPALRTWVRVVRVGRGPCGPQRPDRRRPDARLSAR